LQRAGKLTNRWQELAVLKCALLDRVFHSLTYLANSRAVKKLPSWLALNVF